MNTRKKNILLVEDDKLAAFSQSQALKNFGYEVISASSGEAAVNYVKKDLAVDLILMDIDLGEGIDGTVAARRILECRLIPIVFLTSHSERETVDKVRHITRYGYVIKNSGDFVLQSSIEMAFELFEAEQTQKRIWDMATELICVADINTATFVKVNPAFERMLGYTENELLSKPFTAFIHPDDIEKTNRVITEQLQRGSDVISFDNRYRSKDGSYRILEWNSHPVAYEGVTYAIAHDVTEKREIEKELDYNNRLLKSLMNNLPIGVFMVDAHGGRPLIANSKAVELMGRGLLPDADKDNIGEVYHAYIAGTNEPYPPDQMPIVRGMKGEVSRIDNIELEKPDGTRVLLEVYGSPVFDRDGNIKASIASFTDISDENEAVRALKESERKYKALVSKMDQAVVVCRAVYNEEGHLCDGVILDLNQSCEKITKLTRDEIIGKTLLEVLASSEADWFSRLEDVVKKGEVHHVERYIREFNRYMEITAYRPEVDQFALIVSDITKRKEEETKKLHEKNLLEQLLETSPIGITTVNSEGEVTYANRQAEIILRLSKSNVTERTYNDPTWRIADADGDPFPEEELPFVVVKETKKPVYNVQHSILDEDGNMEILSINAAPLLDASGEFEGMIATVQDITAAIEAQKQIKMLLDEKELLLKEVHHRIKNNMNLVMGLLSLQVENTDNNEARDILENASSRLQSMLVMYDQLYRMGGIDKISLKNYLETLIQEIEKNYTTDKKINFVTSIEDVMIDVKRLSTLGIIVNELITNSIKYAFSDNTDSIISISLKKVGCNLILQISDNGRGMDVSTVSARQGFGLKLVSLLMKQLKSELSFYNDKGLRTVIKFAI